MNPTRLYLLVALAAITFGVHLALCPPPIPVLLLHDVKPQRAGHDFWTLHPDRFRALLDVIDRLGYKGIGLDEARAHVSGRLGLSRAREAVLITVDDGCTSAATLVGPELARRGHAATFFVVAGWGPPEHVSVEQLRGLARSGHDIGSHSLSHASLDVRPRADRGREEARISAELTGSRARLALDLDADVTGLAYPKGDWDATTTRLASAAGYRLAFTTDTGYLMPGADPMELPRYQLNWDTPLEWIENYLRAPRAERERNLVLLASIAALAALGALAAELNRRRSSASCHTEQTPRPPEETA